MLGSDLLLLARNLASAKELVIQPLTMLALVYQGRKLKIAGSLVKVIA